MDVVQGRLVLLLLLLCSVQTDAQYAKTSYYTDTTSDCYISGFLLIRTDDVVNVNSRNPNGRASSDVLRCAIKFRPADQNAIMDMDFSYFTIADKDVTLRVEVSGAGVKNNSNNHNKNNKISKNNNYKSS
nr:hypothetical protein BaRGS_028776 [Batillaria attramentaria]